MSGKKEEALKSVIGSMKLEGFEFSPQELEKLREFIDLEKSEQDKVIKETIERYIKREQ